MLDIQFDLTHFTEAEIIDLSDWHIGNPLCDEALIKNVCDYIMQEPENPKRARVCFMNGDITETITRNSIGDIFNGSQYTPSTQIAIALKYLRPLTKTSKKYPMGKIISNAYGNHDFQRQYKDSGISCATSIACGLGLEDRSSSDGCYDFINLKSLYRTKDNTTFTLYHSHGSGGGSTIGAKANKMEKIGNSILADIICIGHCHTSITFKEDMIIPQTNTHRTRTHTTTYVMVSSMLGYGDYAQRQGIKPSTINVPRIILTQERHYLTSQKQRLGDVRVKNVEVIL